MINFPEKGFYFFYQPACVLRIGGEDAAAFLQGQFSNDLSVLSAGRSVYGLWLDRKGRVVADSHVLREETGGALRVISLFCPAALVRARLEDFIIADDVVVEDDTQAWGGVSLVGPGTGEWLGLQQLAGLRLPGRRDRGEGWEWLLAGDERGVAASLLPKRPAETPGAMERRRIGASIPRIPVDLGPSDLPHEGGLEAEAVSYSKGCYLGQEVMARLKSRGTLRRRLARVEGRGEAPALPAALWSEGGRVGELRSAAAGEGAFLGMAMLLKGSATAGRMLSLSAGAPPCLQVVG